jgi:hypothetical protein
MAAEGEADGERQMGRGGRGEGPLEVDSVRRFFFRRPGAMGMVDGGMIGSGFARGQRYRRGGRIAGSRGGEEGEA